jgi:hypothetical protein
VVPQHDHEPPPGLAHEGGQPVPDRCEGRVPVNTVHHARRLVHGDVTFDVLGERVEDVAVEDKAHAFARADRRDVLEQRPEAGALLEDLEVGRPSHVNVRHDVQLVKAREDEVTHAEAPLYMRTRSAGPSARFAE